MSDSTPSPQDLPSMLSARVEAALACQGQNDLAQAELIFQEVLAVDPAHFVALHQMGTIKNGQGDFEGACRWLEDAIRVNPRSALAHLNLGISLCNLQQFEKALAHFGVSLVIKAGNPDALVNRALANHQLGRSAKAEADLRKALALRPDDQIILNLLAKVSNDQRQVFSALVGFRALCAQAIEARDPGLHH
jgi:Tfp pilus assembly protein PilF